MIKRSRFLMLRPIDNNLVIGETAISSSNYFLLPMIHLKSLLHSAKKHTYTIAIYVRHGNTMNQSAHIRTWIIWIGVAVIISKFFSAICLHQEEEIEFQHYVSTLIFIIFTKFFFTFCIVYILCFIHHRMCII